MLVWLWVMFAAVVYGAAGIIMDQTQNSNRLPLLAVFGVATVLLLLAASRAQVGHGFRRRLAAVRWFLLLVVGMPVFGNLLYPGIFSPGAPVADRVYIGLTAGGWVGASIISVLLAALERLVNALLVFRRSTARPSLPRWLREHWPSALTITVMAGAWTLLRPYSPPLGSSSIHVWLQAIDSRSPWPIPAAVLACIVVLWGWVLLIQRVHGIYQHRQQPALGHQILEYALYWANALMLSSPLWARWAVGFHSLGDLSQWAALWATAVIWPAFLLCVGTASIATTLIIQTINYIRQLREPEQAKLKPPIPMKRRDGNAEQQTPGNSP